jgi:transposase-like protein
MTCQANASPEWVEATIQAAPGDCPNCGGQETESILPDIDGDTVAMDWKCRDCKATWWEQYKQTHLYVRIPEAT